MRFIFKIHFDIHIFPSQAQLHKCNFIWFVFKGPTQNRNTERKLQRVSKFPGVTLRDCRPRNKPEMGEAHCSSHHHLWLP